MHGDLTAERGQFVLVAGGFERDQHADLAEAVGDRIVQVAADRARIDRKHGGAAQRHVLADLGDAVGQRLGNSDAAGLRRLDRLDIGAGIERDIGDHLDETLEQIVAGDEVGLGIDLDHRRLGAAHDDADQTFRGDAAGLLGGLRQALLAQPILRRFHVALGLGQRGLAVHHARASRLAQVLDHLGCNRSHWLIPLRDESAQIRVANTVLGLIQRD